MAKEQRLPSVLKELRGAKRLSRDLLLTDRPLRFKLQVEEDLTDATRFERLRLQRPVERKRVSSPKEV